MNESIDLYTLSPEREEKLWNNAVFVFDSSALLDFYLIPPEAKEKIFSLFSSTLKNRLWIPCHVKFEYEKNMYKSVDKTIETYNALKGNNIKNIKKHIKNVQDEITKLKNKTKNDNKHPFLPQSDIDDYVSNLKSATATLEESICKKIAEKTKEIEEESKKSNGFKDTTKNLFEIGRDYSFDEIMEITKEGLYRFELSIPPGYEDKDKKGFQKFGDLIIWKQIIEFAKERQKSIIFISNDEKEDWYNKHQDKKSPREELIKELYYAANNVEFWMYSLDLFLSKLNEYCEAKIEKTDIENLSKTIARKNKKTNKIIFKCNKCETINSEDVELEDSDFECVATYDTGESRMGDENQHEAEEDFCCSHCGSEITATFTVWEYPIGCNNYTDVKLDGATLIECFNFEINFHKKDEEDLDCYGS